MNYGDFARACLTNEGGGVHPQITRELRALYFLGVLTEEAVQAVAQMNATGITVSLEPAMLGSGFHMRRDLFNFVGVTLGTNGALDVVGVQNVARIMPPEAAKNADELRKAAGAHVQALIRALCL